MGHFLRIRLLWFLIGFVAAFLTYLLIQYDPDDIIRGMLIGVGVGAALSLGLFFLEHWMRDRKRDSAMTRETPPADLPPPHQPIEHR